jgi:5-methyltetrahydropteroyltriglutamate--homocysteine methyltransferase
VTGARIFLNPDCGFGTFSARPMCTAEVAVEKLRVMVAAARMLRAGNGSGGGLHPVDGTGPT